MHYIHLGGDGGRGVRGVGGGGGGGEAEEHIFCDPVSGVFKGFPFQLPSTCQSGFGCW